MSKMQLQPHIRVFVAKYPFDVANVGLPQERQREIDVCLNEQVRQSKYYVFKLLELAVRETYDLDLEECHLTKIANGKWTSDKFELSVTHCGNIVAVAVSSAPVGIDVQTVDSSRFCRKLRQRVLTSAEQRKADGMTEEQAAAYANALWTVKEAVFKRDGGQRFVPKATDVQGEAFKTVLVTDGNKRYYLSVTTADNAVVEYRTVNVEYVEL